MVNYNLEGFDQLEGMFDGKFGTFLATFGVLAIFIIIIFCILAILLWVFSSLGLMNLGKKHKIPNAWLAFFPVGRDYVLGKLGYEVYNKENKNATTFMWITLGLGAASFVLGTSGGELHTLVRYGLLFFESWAFYNIFKKLKPQNAVLLTVFTVLTGGLLGGIFLYFMKTNESTPVQAEQKEEVKTEEPKEKKTEPKKDNSKVGFCSGCGAKLNKNTKFCPECGNKID